MLGGTPASAGPHCSLLGYRPNRMKRYHFVMKAQHAPPRTAQACSLGAVSDALTTAQSTSGGTILISTYKTSSVSPLLRGVLKRSPRSQRYTGGSGLAGAACR